MACFKPNVVGSNRIAEQLAVFKFAGDEQIQLFGFADNFVESATSRARPVERRLRDHFRRQFDFFEIELARRDQLFLFSQRRVFGDGQAFSFCAKPGFDQIVFLLDAAGDVARAVALFPFLDQRAVKADAARHDVQVLMLFVAMLEHDERRFVVAQTFDRFLRQSLEPVARQRFAVFGDDRDDDGFDFVFDFGTLPRDALDLFRQSRRRSPADVAADDARPRARLESRHQRLRLGGGQRRDALVRIFVFAAIQIVVQRAVSAAGVMNVDRRHQNKLRRAAFARRSAAASKDRKRGCSVVRRSRFYRRYSQGSQPGSRRDRPNLF